MNERLAKALFVAIVTALGITLVTLISGEGFSFFKTALYAVIAFVVDYVFSIIFDKKKK